MPHIAQDDLDLPPLPGNGMHYIPTDNSHMNQSFLTADIRELIAQMTVQEKISLLAGKDRWS
jgi:beta-glucosidase